MEMGDEMTADIRLRNALDRAAYALFQIKRMTDVPQHVIDHVREAHDEACKVLDADFAVAEVATPDDVRDAKRYRDRREKAFREAIGVAEGLLTPEAVAQADREKWLKRYDIASDFLPPLLRPV